MDLAALQAKLQSLGTDLPGRLSDLFTHINSAAVLAALIGGWITGWVWYGIAGSLWKASIGQGGMGEFSPRRQIFGGMAQVVMTIMLSSFMQRLGYVHTSGGVHTAWLLWIGFVMPTVLVNYANLGKRLALTLVDGIHWLLVLTVMGVIIGLFNDLGIGTQKVAAPVAPAATQSAAPAPTAPAAAPAAGTTSNGG